MINYVYAFICAVIFYVLIQYYVNNYCSDDQKYLFNSGYNKIILFIGILILFEGVLYLYTSDILKTLDASSVSMSGDASTPFTTSKLSSSSNTSDISLEDFESTFINSIKNKEVDVGVVPF